MNRRSDKTESNEFFYLDADGKKQDAELHAEILDNLEADKAVSLRAIERAMQRGLSRDEAERLWGIPGVTAPAKLTPE